MHVFPLYVIFVVVCRCFCGCMLFFAIFLLGYVFFYILLLFLLLYVVVACHFGFYIVCCCLCMLFSSTFSIEVTRVNPQKHM